MDLADELQRIYDAKINLRISWLVDGGLTVLIGDDDKGYIAEETVPSLADLLPWVQEAIAHFYPESTYAKFLDPEIHERAANRTFTKPRRRSFLG